MNASNIYIFFIETSLSNPIAHDHVVLKRNFIQLQASSYYPDAIYLSFIICYGLHNFKHWKEILFSLFLGSFIILYQCACHVVSILRLFERNPTLRSLEMKKPQYLDNLRGWFNVITKADGFTKLFQRSFLLIIIIFAWKRTDFFCISM